MAFHHEDVFRHGSAFVGNLAGVLCTGQDSGNTSTIPAAKASPIASENTAVTAHHAIC